MFTQKLDDDFLTYYRTTVLGAQASDPGRNSFSVVNTVAFHTVPVITITRASTTFDNIRRVKNRPFSDTD